MSEVIDEKRPANSYDNNSNNRAESDVYSETNGKKDETEVVVSDPLDLTSVTETSIEREPHNLPLEQYMYYARIQREYEYRKDFEGLREIQSKQVSDPHANLTTAKIQSQSTLRKANRWAVFYLITTDILGPSNAPYGIQQMGYVGGIILYIAFGLFACLGGKLLQICFLRLDSDNYPIRTYSDLGSRIFGYWTRYFVSILQFIQMILNVGIIALSTAQALAQCIQATNEDHKICFTLLILFWSLLGMVLGQIRSLRDFSFIANTAVWMNIAICIITMVGAALYPPLYAVTGLTPGPIKVTAGSTQNLFGQMLGVDQMVFAWGGATIFCEVMAEMANPREFFYGLVGADTLIGVVYLFFGLFVYSYQGQFVYAVANQGINTYGLRLAGNILSIISGMIAAALYGNVGLKVLYQGFGVPDLKFPTLNTKKGGFLWGGLIIIFWAVAFVIGAAIPQVAQLSSLVGSLCILNFSYTLPASFMLGLMIKEDAAALDTYHPDTATVDRVDSWKNWARWKRGLCTGTWKRIVAKIFLLVMTLGGLCLCGIGMYGSIESMIQVYGSSSSAGSAFSCSPANYN